jgi:hypothetical protein
MSVGAFAAETAAFPGTSLRFFKSWTLLLWTIYESCNQEMPVKA